MSQTWRGETPRRGAVSCITVSGAGPRSGSEEGQEAKQGLEVTDRDPVEAGSQPGSSHGHSLTHPEGIC